MGNSELLQRILETVTWCKHKADTDNPQTCLRTPELKPAEYVVKADHYISFHADKCQQAQTLLTDLAQKRRELLYRENLAQDRASFSPANGRLMLHVLNFSLDDGLSEWCSEGFFDVIDMPPWDTWIACLKTSELHSGWNMILSWVPSVFCDLVAEGMDAEAVGCIFWASEYRQQAYSSDILDWLGSQGLLF